MAGLSMGISKKTREYACNTPSLSLCHQQLQVMNLHVVHLPVVLVSQPASQKRKQRDDDKTLHVMTLMGKNWNL